MTQQLPDLAQRGSLPEHLRGKRVSEYIGAGCGESTPASAKARWTSVETAQELAKPTRGACSRMNSRRLVQRGRPFLR